MKQNGNLSYIIPISITSSDALSGVHNLLFNNCNKVKISSYAVRPKPVFENAVVNTSILFFKKTLTKCTEIYSTKMHRKGHNFSLQNLIDNLQFAEVSNFLKFGRIPKIGTTIETSILAKFQKYKKVSDFLVENEKQIFYRAAGGRYFKVITPYSCNSSAEKSISLKKEFANSIGCLLSSSLSFWYYQIYSDNLNWKSCEILDFPIPELSAENIKYLENLYQEYLADIEKNAMIQKSSGNSSYKVAEFKVYKIGKSKHIIDKIDDYIGKLYGLTEEEIDFIKNYEIEFRVNEEE